MGIQPSAISPVCSMLFGVIDAMYVGMCSRDGGNCIVKPRASLNILPS